MERECKKCKELEKRIRELEKELLELKMRVTATFGE